MYNIILKLTLIILIINKTLFQSFRFISFLDIDINHCEIISGGFYDKDNNISLKLFNKHPQTQLLGRTPSKANKSYFLTN